MLPMAEFSTLLEPLDNRHLLTNGGTIVGGVALSGRDADSLSYLDKVGLSGLNAVILGSLPPRIGTVQVFAHWEGAELQLKDRARSINHYLCQARQQAVNQRGLTEERLVTFFESEPEYVPGKLCSLRTLEHLGNALDSRSRRALIALLSFNEALKFERAESERQRRDLEHAIETVLAKWRGVMSGYELNLRGLWAWSRFLATMDPTVLERGLDEAIPEHDLTNSLTDGDLRPVFIGEHAFMKAQGPVPRYLQIAAVKAISDKPIHGIFADLPHNGSYVIVSRFKPYSATELWLKFWHKRKELERKSIRWAEMLLNPQDYDWSEDLLRPVLQRKFAELDSAEASRAVWGSWHCYLAAFDTDPKKVLRTATDLHACLTPRGLSLAWQDRDLCDCFAAMQPGGAAHSLLDFSVSLDVASEAAPLFVGAQGVSHVEHLNDEALFPFETRSRLLFWLSVYGVAQRSFVCGVGPVGTGKSTIKNILAAWFLRYENTLLRAIDIDPGAETLATSFGIDAGVFKFGPGGGGMNPFLTCSGIDDLVFRDHLRALLRLLILANDVEELQRFTADDQGFLDKAIDKTLRHHDRPQWNLVTLCLEMPIELQRKFARWLPSDGLNAGGEYAGIFDAPVDTLGDSLRPLGVFNLQSLKYSQALPAVMYEIFHRTLVLFKQPEHAARPKWLDLDEFHWVRSVPNAAKRIESEVLTGRKHGYGISMWSQSPEHFRDFPGWHGIKSAVSVFFFLRDDTLAQPETVKLYRETFDLTPGECETIRFLTPCREAFVKIPHLNISKVVVLDLDPVSLCLTNSNPQDVLYRDTRLAELRANTEITQALTTIHTELEERQRHARQRRKDAA